MDWKFWKPKKSEAPTPEGNVYTLTQPAAPQKTPELILPGGSNNVILSRKKWVMWQNQIGIVWDFDSSGNCTLHLTNEAGETTTVAKVRVIEIRVARFLEIPEPRRRGLTQVEAAALGYF